jgi:hypothetical protein
MQRVLSIFIIVFLLALMVAPAAAGGAWGVPVAASVNGENVVAWLQEVPPPSVIPTIPTPGEALDALNGLWNGLFSSVFGSLIVVVLTGFAKRIPLKFIQDMPATTITLIVSAGVIAVIYAGDLLGFRQYVETAFTIIIALGTGLGFSAAGAQWLYSTPLKGVALIGTSRDVPLLKKKPEYKGSTDKMPIDGGQG